MSTTEISRAPTVTIDWTAEAGAAAERVIEDNEKRQRQANALAPKPSPLFGVTSVKHREFPWSRRVEVDHGATIIHLGDQCALVLFVILPMVGCTLDKVPARGDLFDHMKDHD